MDQFTIRFAAGHLGREDVDPHSDGVRAQLSGVAPQRDPLRRLQGSPVYCMERNRVTIPRFLPVLLSRLQQGSTNLWLSALWRAQRALARWLWLLSSLWLWFSEEDWWMELKESRHPSVLVDETLDPFRDFSERF